jgi:N-acetylneuraminate lyase
MIAPLVEKLIGDGVGGLFVLGTTGEGNLMTVQERKAAAEAFIAATAGRVPVLVHVGHASLHAARDLAAHAAAAGADALAALPPYYHKPDSIEAAVCAMEFIAAAGGGLPLLYYHIPQMSGVALEPAALLEAAAERVPTLAGIKFSHNDVTRLAACSAAAGGRFQVMWGVDESLLAGLTAGAAGGIGSSYNYATRLYAPVLDYAAGGRGATLAAAQSAQERSRRMQSLINGRGGIAAAKALMPALGVDCGPTRLPLLNPDAGARAALHRELEQLGFFNWLGH